MTCHIHTASPSGLAPLASQSSRWAAELGSGAVGNRTPEVRIQEVGSLSGLSSLPSLVPKRQVRKYSREAVMEEYKGVTNVFGGDSS